MKESEDIFSRLLNGEHVTSSDPEGHKLREACYKTKKWLLKMNNEENPRKIREYLGKITKTVIDKSTEVFTPLYINYGRNTKIGKNVFINFDCVFLDLGGITIEDGVLIAPKVSLLTEGHPLQSQNRHDLTVGAIHIKKNAWIGASATILKGVTIGENSVVAAGSIVFQNIPDNVVVGGIPAKILKSIEK